MVFGVPDPLAEIVLLLLELSCSSLARFVA